MPVIPFQSSYTEDFENQIIERQSGTVYRLAYVKTADKNDADDIFQEVFLRFAKARPVFENPEHEKAWFIHVTVNCCNSFLSRKKRTATQYLDEEIPAKKEPVCETGSLAGLLEKLKPVYREVLHLFYYEDMPTAKIAWLLRRPEATVRSQLKRAREMLKNEMQRQNIRD